MKERGDETKTNAEGSNASLSKKYASVFPPLISRLIEEEIHKKAPDSIKAAKTKLHQIYGAYTQDNAHKKAARLLDGLADPITTAKAILSLHASTKERLPYYADFYDFILGHVGRAESILDIGCGYNPFSIPLIPALTKLQAYHAYDIDTWVADLLNRFFACLGLPTAAKCADLAVDIPQETADIALMCKLLPVLESQSPGSGYRLARGLNVRYLLITYPLKSLGGREKGMAKHYSAAFSQALQDGELGKFSLVDERQVGNEMLYILTK